MKLKVLEGQAIEELSMIEVAHAVLDENKEGMTFSDLLDAVKDYLKKSDTEIEAGLARFYTELNTDGSFIPLGDNKWGLRSWYAIDSIDEETINLDYFEEDVIDDVASPTLIDDEEDDASFKAKAVVDEIVYDEKDDDEIEEVKTYDEELAEVEIGGEIPEVEFIDEDNEYDDDSESPED